MDTLQWDQSVRKIAAETKGRGFWEVKFSLTGDQGWERARLQRPLVGRAGAAIALEGTRPWKWEDLNEVDAGKKNSPLCLS